MKLREEVNKDLMKAMKEKNEFVKANLRLLKSSLDMNDKNKGKIQFTDLEILKQAIKQTKDSIVEFAKAKRPDLVKESEERKELLEKYLVKYEPKQLTDDEIKKLVAEYKEQGVKGGAIIGKIVSSNKGLVDGSRVKEFI